MTSRARTQKIVPSSVPKSETLISDGTKTKRQATVYDAVAGKISAKGFIPEFPVIAASRDTASSSSVAVSPEAVLFRRKKAPMRFEESDFYFASESLPPQALPDSDLLKALHCYTSDFYSHATIDGGRGDWRSMDETALLALGILMQELCRETLGRTGDMVFTEGELLDEDLHRSTYSKSYSREGQSTAGTLGTVIRSDRKSSGKRRRLDVEALSN